MSETLVIEWDRDQLLAATGSVGSKTVNVTKAISVSREQGRLLPSEVGDALATSLRSAGIQAEDAIVVFPRDLVTFNRVELPNLSDDEIPDMVTLQAATRLTVPVESVCLDFVPLPVPANSQTREVLLVTVPNKHVNDVKEALKVCGIRLAGVRVSSFSIAASAVHSGMLTSSPAAGSVEAIVTLGSDSIEMIFIDGHSVEFSHSGASWTSLDTVEQAVRSEISRARMAAAEDMGGYNVSRLTLIGDPDITASVPDSISKRLNDAEVVRVDPNQLMRSSTGGSDVVLPEGVAPSDMLAVIGVMANLKTTTLQTVDLVNPRKAAEKPDYTQLKRILVGGGLALVLIGGWGWHRSTVNGLNTKAEKLNAKANELKVKYKASSDQRRLDDDLTVWKDRDLNWLDEIEHVRELMGGTDRVLIRKFSFGTRSGSYLGTIDAEGYAKTRIDIEDLMKMLADKGYEVSPTEMVASMRDPNYKMALKLEVSIPTSIARNGEAADGES